MDNKEDLKPAKRTRRWNGRRIKSNRSRLSISRPMLRERGYFSPRQSKRPRPNAEIACGRKVSISKFDLLSFIERTQAGALDG
jgi:hypothetical protein